MGLVKKLSLSVVIVIIILALCFAAFPTYLVVDRILGGEDMGEAIEEVQDALTS